MSEDDLVAPSAATEEVVTPAETPENTEPAQTEAETAEQSETQKRRERRKAQEQRTLDEKTAADKKAADLEDRLRRVQASAAGHQEPKEADYTDIGAYWAAMGAFNYARQVAQSAVREVGAEVEQAKQASEIARAAHMQVRQAEFEDEKTEARKRYADFDAAFAVVVRADILSPAVSDMVLQADQPADLAYHLGKNPDLARSLSSMPPQAAAYALGKIAAGLQVPQPKIASNAPPPINPLKPSGAASKSPADMDANEYAAWRKAGGTFS